MMLGAGLLVGSSLILNVAAMVPTYIHQANPAVLPSRWPEAAGQ